MPESPPAIKLSVDPGTISGSEDGGQPKAGVDVAVNKTTMPWKVDVTAPEGSNCPQPSKSGTDNTHLDFPFDASSLGNGVYKLKASYQSLPAVFDEKTINVQIPVKVIVDKATFNPLNNEKVTFKVSAPTCPNWSLKLTGIAESPGLVRTCTFLLDQKSGTQQIPWDGTCKDDIGTGIATGTWTATLNLGGQEQSVAVEAIPVPSPTPTASPGPLECPPGEVCPQPTQTPPSPGPTQTPFPGDTPTPGPTETPGQTSTPGATSTPSTGPTWSPNPNRTPNPKPTPEKRFRTGACTEEDGNADPRQQVLTIAGKINGLVSAINQSGAKRANSSGGFGLAAINSEPGADYWALSDYLNYVREEKEYLKALLMAKQGFSPIEPPVQADYTDSIRELDWKFGNSPNSPTLLEKVGILYAEASIYERLVTNYLQMILTNNIDSYESHQQLQALEVDIHKHTLWIADQANEWAELSEFQKQRFNSDMQASVQMIDNLIAVISEDETDSFHVLGGPETGLSTSRIVTILTDVKNAVMSYDIKTMMAAETTALATLSKAPLLVNPYVAGSIIVVSTALGVATLWHEIAVLQALCNEPYIRGYGDYSLNKLNQDFVATALAASELAKKAATCTATKSTNPQISQSAIQAVQGVQSIVGQNFGAKGKLTKMLTELTQLVKRDDEGENRSEILTKMANAGQQMALVRQDIPNMEKKLKVACENQENDCGNGEDLLELPSSKDLQKSLRDISDDPGVFSVTRIIAAGAGIFDWPRLVIFYADNNQALAPNFVKKSTGNNYTFELTRNVRAPYGYQGLAQPKLGVFCKGDDVEAHWYEYSGKKPTTVLQPNQKFEFKLKCYGGKCRQWIPRDDS